MGFRLLTGRFIVNTSILVGILEVCWVILSLIGMYIVGSWPALLFTTSIWCFTFAFVLTPRRRRAKQYP